MDIKHVFTGSCETEHQLKLFAANADSIDAPVPRNVFRDDYMWNVMTDGRAGPKDAYPGSTAPDDTGGYFVERDGMVYLTDKAKSCIHV